MFCCSVVSFRGRRRKKLEKYNKFCEQGEDEDFGRDPKMLLPINQDPFYGFYCAEERPYVGTCALNGVNIDENQSVLDANYNPIVGLYATGNNSGGRFAIEYSTPMQGLTLGSPGARETLPPARETSPVTCGTLPCILTRNWRIVRHWPPSYHLP